MANDWKPVENIPDRFREDPWTCAGHERTYNGKQIQVLLNYAGEGLVSWRLYIDGDFIKVLDKVNTIMGSGKDAMETADTYIIENGI